MHTPQDQQAHQASGEANSIDARSPELLEITAHLATEQTTVMLRNLPIGSSRDDLCALLDRLEFNTKYDFVYLPTNFRTQATFGYSFVNMISHEDAEKLKKQFDGFTAWGVESDKVCEASWSDMHQGLPAHIERYRNSPIMHESVQDAYKPAIFAGGVRVAFPEPTRRLRLPRVRQYKEGGDGKDEEAGDDM